MRYRSTLRSFPGELRRHWRSRIFWLGVRHVIPSHIWHGEQSLAYRWMLQDLSHALQMDRLRKSA